MSQSTKTKELRCIFDFRFLFGAVFIAAISPAYCAEFDYGLEPREIAPDTYVFEGHVEHFTFANGGNIQNTAFVVTSDGVVVWDTGPSRAYGAQMRKAIARVTDKPIASVFLSHQHPDHFLGNQAFADVPILALQATVDGIREQGPFMVESMYRLAGQAMFGTELKIPKRLDTVGELNIGDHDFVLYDKLGHTDGDLVIFDRTTGVLFAGDLVFAHRAPTTPHAEINEWLDTLAAIQSIGASVIVPGHGPVSGGKDAVESTAEYLRWLDSTLRRAATEGEDMAELINLEIPAQFQDLHVVQEELQRSIAHLYPALEQSALRPLENVQPVVPK